MFRSLIAGAAGAALLAAASAAQSATLIYSANLAGSNEVPSNNSPATGFSVVTINDVANTLSVHETFNGLVGGPASAAHIHCCTPVGTNTGVAVPFTGFPGATGGTYDHTFDLTSTSIYTSTFLSASGGTAAGAEAALLAGLADEQAYANIHNATFPGGEIRGFLEVPEPASWALMIFGAGLAGAALRRRRWAVA